MGHRRGQRVHRLPVELVAVQDELPERQRRQHRELGLGQEQRVRQEVVGQVEELEAPEDGQELEDLLPLGQEVVSQVQLGDVSQPARVDAVGTCKNCSVMGSILSYVKVFSLC